MHSVHMQSDLVFRIHYTTESSDNCWLKFFFHEHALTSEVLKLMLYIDSALRICYDNDKYLLISEVS